VPVGLRRSMLIRSLARTLRILTIGCLVLVLGGLGLLLVGLKILALRQERQVDRAWGKTRESLTALERRFPPRDPNPTARALVKLTAPLGIDLSTSKGEARPSEAQTAAFTSVKNDLSNYLRRQVRRTDLGNDPIPENVDRYLATHRAALIAVRNRLISGELPRWKQFPDQLYKDSEPKLLGILWIERVLLMEALRQQRQGEHGAACEFLRAAWAVEAALGERPERISQLIALHMGTLLTGTLRQVGGSATEWRERLARLPSRDSLLTALEYEAASMSAWVRRGAPDGLPGSFLERQPFRLFLVQYERLCYAGFAEEMRRVVAELLEENLCEYDVAAARQLWAQHFPEWNRLARISWPNSTENSPWRLLRSLLDRELTLEVLEARETFAATDRWPESGAENSRACPNERWVLASRDDGGLTISFSRDVGIWPKYTSPLAPLEFCLDRGPASDLAAHAGSTARR
jgi:hypothetical protein